MRYLNTIKKYTCPCCGYISLKESPGSDEICEICYWHDDYASLLYARVPIGGNKVSLIAAQKNFTNFKAKEERLIDAASKSRNASIAIKDPSWRQIDLEKDTFIDYSEDRCPADLELLYYWRDTYWLRKKT
jgi:hypothetical protein